MNRDDTAQPTPGRARWWREPLLHFLLLGAVLFGIDHLLNSQRDESRRIVLDASADRAIRDAFRNARGQEPDAAQLKALRQVWLDNEVLYREGLAMQVDKGDSAIRERVIFKALSVVDAGLPAARPDAATLRAWFEQNRSRYDEPARVDFEEAALAGSEADASEAAVRAFVADLAAGRPGSAEAGLRVFTARPVPTLAPSYGPDFAEQLQRLPPGAWQALPTRSGWRAIRLVAVQPGRPASFESLQPVLVQDWVDATMAERRSAAVAERARQYRIVIEGAPAEAATPRAAVTAAASTAAATVR